jgi:hypothetical protein
VIDFVTNQIIDILYHGFSHLARTFVYIFFLGIVIVEKSGIFIRDYQFYLLTFFANRSIICILK